MLRYWKRNLKRCQPGGSTRVAQGGELTKHVGDGDSSLLFGGSGEVHSGQCKNERPWMPSVLEDEQTRTEAYSCRD